MEKLKYFALQRYFRCVQKHLTCPRKQKKQILNDLKTNISVFLEEHPQADIQLIQSHFGSPQQIASTYLGDLTDTELLHKLQMRKTIIAVIVGAMVTVLVIWLTVVGWAIVKEQKNSSGGAVIGQAVDAAQ